MCNHYCSFNESPNAWIIFGNYIQFLDESLGFAPKVSHLHILYIYKWIFINWLQPLLILCLVLFGEYNLQSYYLSFGQNNLDNLAPYR